MNWEMLLRIAAVCGAAAGAWTDLKTHRIPNRLTGFCILAGLISRPITGGISGWLAGGYPGLLSGAAGGLFTGLSGFLMGGVFVFLWLLGALKAGDIKLYMAVGALGGWRFCLNTQVYSILAGGIAAFIIMAVRKRGRDSLKRLWLYGRNLLLSRSFSMYEGDGGSYFCFGCFIALGAFLACFWPILSDPA